MALQFSTAVRNAMLDAIETTMGEGEIIRVFTGAAPANCAAADSGTKLAEWTLAGSGDWAAASGGSKALAGTPLVTTAVGSGTAGYARWYSSGSVCGMQGSVTLSGGGGDVTLDNTNIQTGQQTQITGFSMTAPGA